MEQRTGAEPVEETVRTGPWLEVYQDLSARDPAGLAAVELDALAEAAWWLCKADESIAARQRAYAAFRARWSRPWTARRKQSRQPEITATPTRRRW